MHDYPVVDAIGMEHCSKFLRNSIEQQDVFLPLYHRTLALVKAHVHYGVTKAILQPTLVETISSEHIKDVAASWLRYYQCPLSGGIVP